MAFVQCLPVECAVSAIVVVTALPFLKSGCEESGSIDDLSFEEAVELLVVDAWDLPNLPLRRDVRGLMRIWPMPLSSRCQCNADPNSWPLSVGT